MLAMRAFEELLSSELDRLAVRGTLRGRLPLIPTLQKQAACHQALVGADAFQRCHPMDIVGVATVRVACGLGVADWLCQTFSPFCPREQTTLVPGQRHRAA